MLIRDDRSKLAGAPGIHAFIAGVSLYQHLPDGGGQQALKTFGLRQLSSTAATAFLVYQWLLDAEKAGRLPLPIATIHLLLSPSRGESARLPGIATSGADRCTRANFVRDAFSWQERARGSNDDLTFFYFAGHGVQRRQKDAVLLMDDFGARVGGSLFNAIDVHELINGMAPPSPFGIVAHQQIYFIDACRMPSSEFREGEWRNVAPLWDIDEPAPDNRTAPVFYATIPGASAFAVRGEQTLFSFALFDCLDRAAAVAPSVEDANPRWRVTTWSLLSRLGDAIAKVNADKGGDQEFSSDGPSPRDVVLDYLAEPPEVEVLVTLDPDDAAAQFQLDIEDDVGKRLTPIAPLTPHPKKFVLRAGVYGFEGKPTVAGSPFRNFRRLKPVELPRCVLKEKV